MPHIIFLDGIPGSGKTTARRIIKQWAKQHYIKVVHLDDFYVMLEWARQGLFPQDLQINATGTGFDVINPQIMEHALEEIESLLTGTLSNPQVTEDLIVLIEFARDNFAKAVLPLFKDHLTMSVILHIEVSLSTGWQRTQEREQPTSSTRSLHDRLYGNYTFDADPLLANGATVVSIDNEDLTREEFTQEVMSFLASLNMD